MAIKKDSGASARPASDAPLRGMTSTQTDRRLIVKGLVGPAGFEPATNGL